MKVLVKICGLTNVEDARVALECGANFLGFVMVKKSPRYVTVEQVKKIIDELPSHSLKVGVFQNARVNDIEAMMRECNLDIAQLHGRESVDTIRRLGPERVWKTVTLEKEADVKKAGKYPASALLVDTAVGELTGGTGQVGNWQLAANLASQRRIVLAGGLTPRNIAKAIREVRPHAVDVSSGVEKTPGKKDPERVKKFIEIVQATVR